MGNRIGVVVSNRITASVWDRWVRIWLGRNRVWRHLRYVHARHGVASDRLRWSSRMILRNWGRRSVGRRWRRRRWLIIEWTEHHDFNRWFFEPRIVSVNTHHACHGE